LILHFFSLSGWPRGAPITLAGADDFMLLRTRRTFCGFISKSAQRKVSFMRAIKTRFNSKAFLNYAAAQNGHVKKITGYLSLSKRSYFSHSFTFPTL